MSTKVYHQKQKVADALKARMQAQDLSDSKVAAQIGGISEATIGHIRSGRWREGAQLVSAEKFQKVATWLGIDNDWVVVRTDHNFKKIQVICEEAQWLSESFAISAAPGNSKTESAYDYASTHKNVFFLGCAAHWTKKVFLQKLLLAMGQQLTVGEGLAAMCDRIVSKLNGINKPLIILDEADKLSDRIFQFFITFYNDTYTNCGFVFLGSVFFEMHTLQRVTDNRQGYAEYFSRIGRRFEHLRPLDESRITAICNANDLLDEIDINRIVNTCNGDMRMIKREVQLLKKKKRLSSSAKNREEVAA
jgi:transcriptional regulator with XRE-family HTH domain